MATEVGWGELRACTVSDKPYSLPALPVASCYPHHPPSSPLELHPQHPEHENPYLGNDDNQGFHSTHSSQHPQQDCDAISPKLQKSALLYPDKRKVSLSQGQVDLFVPCGPSSDPPEVAVLQTSPPDREQVEESPPIVDFSEESSCDKAARRLHHQNESQGAGKEGDDCIVVKTSPSGHAGKTCISKVDASKEPLGLFHVPCPPPDTSSVFTSPPPLPLCDQGTGASFFDKNGLAINTWSVGPTCFEDDLKFLPPPPPSPPSPPPPPPPPPPPVAEQLQDSIRIFSSSYGPN